MQQASSTQSAKMLINAFKRRKKAFFITSGSLLVIAMATTFLLPSIYRSSATILIEQQEIPQDLVRSTITSFADQRIQSITQRVMTSANLWSVIEKHDLYADERKREPREVVIEEMREDISTDTISADVIDPRSGRPMKATIAFRIAYDNEGARKAQAVANELTTLFLKENLKSRTELAEQTEVFLKSEASKLAVKIQTLETEIAQFKRDNINALPENTDLNMRLADRTESEMDELDRMLRSLRQQETSETAQLQLLDPYNIVSMENGDRLMSPHGQLKALKQQRIALVSQYSESHPTVQRIDRQIESITRDVGDNSVDLTSLQKRLEQTRIQLAAAKDRYSADHPDVVRLTREIAAVNQMIASASMVSEGGQDANRAPDNPAYVQQKARLENIRAEMASLRQKRTLLQERLDAYESRLLTGPAIEDKYRDLQRDYENASLKFREVKAKQLEAQLSSALESEQKGEKFTLIEPPLMPEKPVKPNRIIIGLMGVLLSLGAGIGVVMLRESLDSSIKDREHLTDVMGMAPLTVIPYIVNTTDLRLQRKQKQIALMTSVAFILIIATGMHLLFMPLDVLWFVTLRRFGIT